MYIGVNFYKAARLEPPHFSRKEEVYAYEDVSFLFFV